MISSRTKTILKISFYVIFFTIVISIVAVAISLTVSFLAKIVSSMMITLSAIKLTSTDSETVEKVNSVTYQNIIDGDLDGDGIIDDPDQEGLKALKGV